MLNNYSNWEKREDLSIKDSEDYREKIKLYYSSWEENGLSEEWIKSFKNRWQPSTEVFDFIKLLKAKKDLSEDKYKAKEYKTLKKFEELKTIVFNFLLVLEAEEEAFKKAGIDEGRVEYKCPICGGTAIANRYKSGGSYHGLGSGCPTCGTSHT
jgi:hypothetical protein